MNGVQAAKALGVQTGGNPPRNVLAPATITDIEHLRETLMYELVAIRAQLVNLTEQTEALSDLQEIVATLKENPLVRRMMGL